MNPVEIEQAISAFAEEPFDVSEFPYLFLQAFGNPETTIKRLRKGGTNKSDLRGVLQTSNIHIAVAPQGEVTKMLAALKVSPATAKAKAKFVLATDGDTFEAEEGKSCQIRTLVGQHKGIARSFTERVNVTFETRCDPFEEGAP